ncbi:MAG: hypothetical protein U1E40_17660 [Amaricoccus sp.]
MTRISALILSAAITGFGLAAQASVEPAATPTDGSAATLAMGAGPDWCAPQATGKEDASGKGVSCEKVARNSPRY